MRLIDADKLKCDTEWSVYFDDFMSYSQIQIECAPTIDRPTKSQFRRMAAQLGYEPVTRCKDCIRQQECKNAQHLGCDGFCSYGERKR